MTGHVSFRSGLCASLVLATAALAQQPSFEVASIRPHEGPIKMISRNTTGTSVTVIAYTVRSLMMDAFNLKPYQVEVSAGKANAWITEDSYDITARVSGDGAPSNDEVRGMLGVLLAQRFHLKFHREMREVSVYALTVAKSGPKLQENAASGPLMRMSSAGSDTQMTFTGAPIDMLVRQLGGIFAVERPVLDKTGLPGRYDFRLNLSQAAEGGATLTGPGGESLFTAIEEQLGLKLESQKGSIEVFVLEHVDRPSDN